MISFGNILHQVYEKNTHQALNRFSLIIGKPMGLRLEEGDNGKGARVQKAEGTETTAKIFKKAIKHNILRAPRPPLVI